MFTNFIINNNNNFPLMYCRSFFFDHDTLFKVGVTVSHMDIITPLVILQNYTVQ